MPGRRRARRVVERRHHHRGANPQAFRPLRDRRRIDLGGGDDAIGGKQVLGDPGAVEAKLLGQFEQVRIGIEDFDPARLVGDLAQAEDAPRVMRVLLSRRFSARPTRRRRSAGWRR